MECPSCQFENAADSRFCNSCGLPLTADATPTLTGSASEKPPSSSSRSSSDGGRFPAGSILEDRYRIIGKLGRGGMGEVYHAHDGKLDQEVALKFLPEAAADASLLERFRAEVRIARQISHPNVCRVYDMGEMEGTPFISMEYVDGEDLRSLLKRIGRLPGDKAVEIARRLCAGLAAAHGTGVLHRDLKPANIMIDGEGQVHIMDFGLAVVSEDIPDVQSGTPAYMAPEQAAGRSVSTRSDIYSLGMVLFEMFTGKRAFDESSDRTDVPSATGVVGDVDPAVETVIRRCLDPNPARRPESALDVARALPGGDPLAEALAAGDTPSPEMVAASDDTGALSIRAALGCLVFIGVGLAVLILMNSWTEVLTMIPATNSPEFLAGRAREIATDLGYPDPPADSAYTLARDGTAGSPMADWLRENLEPEEFRKMLSNGRPPVVFFVYRQSPRDLVPINAGSFVGPGDPPAVISGMVEVRLDLEGRLVFFSAVPPTIDADSSPSTPVDWTPVFQAAGIDPSSLTPAEPEYVPLRAFNERAAWTGYLSEDPSIGMRIEAAAWKGRPVFFNIEGPWFTPGRQVVIERTLGQRAQQWLVVSLIVLITTGAAFLAWRNYRRGRGDLAGATRLAAFALVVWLIQWVLTAHHVPFPSELNKLSWALAEALFFGALFLMLYVALEPYVRRRWPQSLISWTRLLGGDWRDPVVGGHVLLGTAAGVGVAIVFDTSPAVLVESSTVPGNTSLPMLLGVSDAVAIPLRYLIGSAIPFALSAFFFYFLLRVLLKREWLAASVFITIAIVRVLLTSALPPIHVIGMTGLAYGALIWIIRRFGVLPFVILDLVQFTVNGLPVTPDLSSWYSYATILALLFVVGLSAVSFYIALGGRSVLREDFLEA